MFTFDKSGVSIALAVLAVSISAVTLHLVHLGEVEMTLTAQNIVRPSNARGGLPDIEVTIELSAQGPSAKHLSVREIRGTLHTLDGKTCTRPIHLVGSNRVRSRLPAILNGGEKRHLPLLLVNDAHNSPPSARIRKHTRWCQDLRIAAPVSMKTKEVDRICKAFKEVAETLAFDKLCQDDEDCKHRDAQGIALDVAIGAVLSEVESTQLRDLLHFRAGKYELEVQAILGDNRVGAKESFQFEILEEDSGILAVNFNQNYPFRMSLTDSPQCQGNGESD